MKQASVILTFGAMGAVATVMAMGAGPTEAGPADVGAVLRALREKYALPGMVGAIVRGEKVVAIGSVGVRKEGERAEFSVTDEIHLGSDTKAMTAVLIGQLIDKKQLAFGTMMKELFPEMAGKINARMATITVRDLLNHTAGLPHDLDWAALNRTRLPVMGQRRMALEQALAAAPATEVGKYAYSNAGYVLLGAIVENKTGKAWEEVMKEKIFAPLKMASAGFGVPGAIGKVEEPWGHRLENGKWTPVQIDNPAVMGPAGTVHCSMGDWAKFIMETMKGAQGRPTLVSAATFKELTTPAAGQEYAGGWISAARPWAGGVALTHAGSNTSWFCSVWVAPKKDFAVMVAMNAAGGDVPKAADEGVGKLIEMEGKMGAGR